MVDGGDGVHPGGVVAARAVLHAALSAVGNGELEKSKFLFNFFYFKPYFSHISVQIYF